MADRVDARRVVLYGMLGLATVVAALFSPLTRSLWKGRAAPASVARAPSSSGQSAVPASQAPRVSEATLAAWRREHGRLPARNPFLTAEEAEARASPPPAAPAAKKALPAYRVRAILISEGFKVAAIDARLVSEGDQLGEERVAEIRADAVVLERAGERRAIELGGGSIPLREETLPRPPRRPRS